MSWSPLKVARLNKATRSNSVPIMSHHSSHHALTPYPTKTASTAAKDSVRVVWVSSSRAEIYFPKGGVDMTNIDYKKDKNAWWKYGASKAGNVLHASEFAQRFEREGIISIVRFEAIKNLMRRSDSEC